MSVLPQTGRSKDAASRVVVTSGVAGALACVATLVLCYAFMFGSSGDEEEFRFAILSAWLRVRGPWNLDSAFWTPLLGLGVPQPFVPNFTLHPLAPLLAWMPVIAWVRLLLVAHSVVGAVGMWRLGGRVLGFPPIVRAAAVATFLFSAPVQNYVLVDFWPSHLVVWTLLPWMLMMAWRVIDPDTPESHVRRWAGGLGLVCGVVAANANPAYLVVFVPLAAAIVASRWHTTKRRMGWMAVAALIAGAMAAPLIVQLVTERPYFDPGLSLPNEQNPLSLHSAWMALMHPLLPDPAMGMRTLFFGTPFTVLAVVGCVWFTRRHLDLVLGGLVSAMLLFTTWVPMPVLSQRYQFRDPVTLCGILLAGLALTRIMAQRRGYWLGVMVVALQMVAVGAGAAPTLRGFLAEGGRLEQGGRSARAYHGAIGDTALMDTLVDRMPLRGRLLYSPRVNHGVMERMFVFDGLGVNAPAYRGISLVNGSFKGASTGVVSPDYKVFYGRTQTPQRLMESDATLDVLDIRYVLAYRDEPVARGLKALTTVTTARQDALVLYENPDAWPAAFLVQSSFGDGAVPVLAGCDDDRMLCRDFGAVVPHRDAALIEVTRADDRIQIAFAQPSAPNMLVVSEMFRPGWTATAGAGRLATRPMLGGLIGVPIPAGVREVILRYQPRGHRMAFVVWLAGLLAAIGLIAARRRRVA